MFFLILLLATLTANAGNLGNSDFATCAYWSGAGGSIAQCLNTSKIYDSTNAQLLDTTIAAKLNISAFTDAAVTSKLLTGYVSGAGVVAATDSILQAIQKLNGNIAANGSGDVVGPASAVDGEIALFDGITGKLIKSATGTGIVKVTSGVFGTAIAGDFPTLNQSTTGNAATATALAANPSDCGAGTKATAIDASGNLTCSAVADADISAGVDAAKIADGSVSNTEFQYINSVTSNVQTQLNAKLDKSGGTMTGLLTTEEVKETVVAGGTCSTSYNIDMTSGTMFTLTLSGACSIDVTNLAAGHSFTIRLTQSSTTAPTLAAKFKFQTAPTFSTSATKYDTISCASFDGVRLECGAITNAQ